MQHKIEEEQKTQLLQDDHSSQLIGGPSGEKFNVENVDGDDLDIRPSSSRVKKVLIWNPKRQEFEMSEEDKAELRDVHIKDPSLWRQFEESYRSL